jgi:Mg/Co/Ni transporter MgtE
MRKVKYKVKHDIALDELKAYFKDNDLAFVYAVDEKNMLQGYYLAEEVLQAKDTTNLLNPVAKSFLRRNFVKDIIAMVDESDIDIPIVDATGRLRGLINGSDILKLMK